MVSTTQEVQDEFLNTIRKSQETVIEAIKSWVDAVQSVTPKLPSVSVPLADKLPTPQDAVANVYNMAEQLLADQRKFAEDMVKAMELPSGENGNAKAAK